MRPRAIALAGLALLAATSLVACESTQSRSAELEKEGAKTLLADSGVKIEKESTEVKVTSATVLNDSNGGAVVVSLHNSSEKNLVDVPILIEVLDAKGKSVYTNAIPGIEPALAAVPYIPAGGDVDWVNDQVMAAGKPKSVKVKVGASTDSYSGKQPEIEVSAPKVEGDPVSGIEATGTVINKTGEDQERLLLYAVGRSGGKVVAAGRGAIEHLKAGTKPLHYDIFFIGDPTGTDLEVSQFPTLPGSGSE
ncbi:MAG TPA: hypothetical protein VN758_01905 [Solirubrobacterales bacterium]|nr:hypothetical protein [Solirubrobacterales bacterium]